MGPSPFTFRPGPARLSNLLCRPGLLIFLAWPVATSHRLDFRDHFSKLRVPDLMAMEGTDIMLNRQAVSYMFSVYFSDKKSTLLQITKHGSMQSVFSDGCHWPAITAEYQKKKVVRICQIYPPPVRGSAVILTTNTIPMGRRHVRNYVFYVSVA